MDEFFVKFRIAIAKFVALLFSFKMKDMVQGLQRRMSSS